LANSTFRYQKFLEPEEDISVKTCCSSSCLVKRHFE